MARTPELLHMRPDAVSELAHLFCTGDRVDLLFENHRPLRAVVEGELGGEQNLTVGVHQAIKYRSLAAAERTMSPTTGSFRESRLPLYLPVSANAGGRRGGSSPADSGRGSERWWSTEDAAPPSPV